jgi:hypothetical protein
METAETGKTSSISKRYIQFDNILSTRWSQAEVADLPDPANNHGSSLLALLHIYYPVRSTDSSFSKKKQ